MNDKQKKLFIQWVKNHPDVWHENEHGVSHYWWVQNCLGDIFGWDEKTLESLAQGSELKGGQI